jgi:hypothetical protein
VYKGIWWTLGRYDTVVLFEAGDEKAAMNMVLRRTDRMDNRDARGRPGRCRPPVRAGLTISSSLMEGGNLPPHAGHPVSAASWAMPAPLPVVAFGDRSAVEAGGNSSDGEKALNI